MVDHHHHCYKECGTFKGNAEYGQGIAGSPTMELASLVSSVYLGTEVIIYNTEESQLLG